MNEKFIRVVDFETLTNTEIDNLKTKQKAGKLLVAEGLKGYNKYPQEVWCWEVDDQGKTIDGFVIKKKQNGK